MRVNYVEYDENLYTYDELSKEAKERAKSWALEAFRDANDFTDMVEDSLDAQFPNSKLKVEYDLGNSQGDGLNIYGQVSMNDFMPHFDASEDAKSLMQRYIDILDYYGDPYVELSENRARYSYSYKFVDMNHAEDTAEYIACDIEGHEDYKGYIESADVNLITDFLTQVYEYFQELDKTWEKTGYEFFYEISDEEMQDISDANEYEYYEDGRLAG